MTVSVIGTAGRPLDDAARATLREADLVVGSAAALALAAGAAPGTTERMVLGPLEPALSRIAEAGSPVVLASGDPGWFGVLRSLRERGLDCSVTPEISSVARAYAAAAEPWDDAVVVSAHGRDLDPAVNACRAFGNVAVLTAPAAGAVEIARALDGWTRDLVVAERLGSDNQRVIRAAAADIASRDRREFADPHVVLSLDPARGSSMRRDNQPAAAPDEGWALPEDAYEHRDSMITKRDVRAVVVAHLRPRLGRLVIDVGAGSGSVGIECNRLGAAVIAVDRDADACALVRRNAEARGARVRIVHAAGAEALRDLPAADAAFVGGGGPSTLGAVIARRVPRIVASFAALDRVVAAHSALTDAGYLVEGTQVAASRVATLPGGSLRLVAANPVVVLVGELP